jgi:Flp pilus assembly protein TadD
MEKFFNNSKSLVLYLLVFLFPLFFLPVTQEFFITNKLYLLLFGALLLLLTSTIYFLSSKKLSWKSHPFDGSVILFLLAVALSILVSSPNKFQALLNVNFGLVGIFSLVVLYFYLSRTTIPSIIYHLLSIILSIVTIVFFFQPFKNIALPQNLVFLKNPAFTPVGSQLDLAIFLGFFVVLGIFQIIKQQSNNRTIKQSIFNFGLLTFNLLALFLTLYSLLKPSTGLINQASTLILPPFRLSWYAAVETLKRPLTALFGIGVDNFSSMFTAVKDFTYNQSSLWQVNSFSVGRSTLLHIMTETGLFGLIAFGLLIFNVFQSTMKQSSNLTMKFVIGYLSFVILFFPPSLPLFFLLFLTIALLEKPGTGVINHAPTTQEKSLDLKGLMPVYLGVAIVSFVLITGAGYFLGRSYASEYFFKKSLDGYVNNNAKEVYDNQRQAILINPYIERFRTNFSQTNLMIANNIASKANQPATTESTQLTEQDRQTITQAIQAAISEAKAAVTLNPQKADNWENLAAIYRNVLAVAQGADAWTVSAYQRAIVLDPQNPIYRLNLGGVYYTLKDYNQANSMFQQAASLKPDWANARYNLAWSSYQKADYQLAATEMQNVLTLVDPKLNKADYEKVQKELEEFKKMLPKEEKEATQEGEIKPGTLNLPTLPETKVEPKIELPKEASPEAR